MSDRDDDLSRRYRALASEEPPPALDAAILAAAGRAAHRRGPTRWAGPVSIAAVLVLGIGISVRMQMEEPGIETAPPTPSGMPPVAQAPAAAPAMIEPESTGPAMDAAKPPAAPAKAA